MTNEEKKERDETSYQLRRLLIEGSVLGGRVLLFYYYYQLCSYYHAEKKSVATRKSPSIAAAFSGVLSEGRKRERKS